LNERHRLDLLGQRAASLDPALMLRRGYSITLHNGKAVRRATDLHPGDETETRLAEGTLRSVVQSVAASPPPSQKEVPSVAAQP
jgi:exodeoxyribonuclease VII large subunit